MCCSCACAPSSLPPIGKPIPSQPYTIDTLPARVAIVVVAVVVGVLWLRAVMCVCALQRRCLPAAYLAALPQQGSVISLHTRDIYKVKESMWPYKKTVASTKHVLITTHTYEHYNNTGQRTMECVALFAFVLNENRNGVRGTRVTCVGAEQLNRTESSVCVRERDFVTSVCFFLAP